MKKKPRWIFFISNRDCRHAVYIPYLRHRFSPEHFPLPLLVKFKGRKLRGAKRARIKSSLLSIPLQHFTISWNRNFDSRSTLCFYQSNFSLWRLLKMCNVLLIFVRHALLITAYFFFIKTLPHASREYLRIIQILICWFAYCVWNYAAISFVNTRWEKTNDYTWRIDMILA